MIPCIRASMNLSPSVHKDKEEQCSSIMNIRDKQRPLAPYFGSNRSWGQRGRTGFLKPFRHFYMTGSLTHCSFQRVLGTKYFRTCQGDPCWPIVCLSDPDICLFQLTSHYSSISAITILAYTLVSYEFYRGEGILHLTCFVFYVLIAKHKFNRYLY